MGLKGQDAVACWGGLGTYVTRGERRVSELECHANCLRQTLDHLESMLPTALIEASIAVQKGERPPDLLKLTTDPEEPAEASKCRREAASKNASTWNSGDNTVDSTDPCGYASKKYDYLAESDEPQVCMLRTLAKKEKFLRKKIYDMECREECYIKALDDVGKESHSAAARKTVNVCKPDCHGLKNPVVKRDQRTSLSGQDDSVQQRIQQLEANNKKMSVNLKNLQRERAELSHEAKALTEELRCTQKCLGQVQGKVLGTPSCKLIQIMGEPSMTGICESPPPCCGRNSHGAKKPPQNPEALRALAGQFKDAYRKAEDDGLSSSAKEPIRHAAERLRALSNIGDDCPCGEPVKCDSCVVCSCADWERDLEGGGDELEEENPYEMNFDDRFERGPNPCPDRCRCGCYETSSESECPCGCRDNILGDETEQTIVSGASTSDPTTITDTTIPSSIPTTSENEGETNRSCCICTAEQPCHVCCKVCECQSTRKLDPANMEEKCEICKCWEPDISSRNDGSCNASECECTMCSALESLGQSPPCLMCQPAKRAETQIAMAGKNPENRDIFEGKDDSFSCSCPRPPDAPPEIQKVCKVDKLREGLENLKNRNHALRKLLKDCGCLPRVDATKLAQDAPEQDVCNCPETQGPIRRTTSGLISTVRQLQNKCRTKDGMIIALADELKRGATSAQTTRIFECLADPGLCCRVNDFDRSELWKYLRPLEGSHNARDPEEPELGDCYCRIELKEPQPPRNLSVVGRVSGDVLIVAWRPPLSGPVAGYEVLVDAEIVCRVRTPRRTEALLSGLDLRSSKLIEVRTIGPNGLHSVTIERLYNPDRCPRL